MIKEFEFAALILLMSVFFMTSAKAEGLPANPWKNKPTAVNTDTENQVSPATDLWNKVRNTENFRQWHIPESDINDSKTQKTEQTEENKQNLLAMLANLNRVGYNIPSDYKNIVNKMSSTQKTQKSASLSYQPLMRQWQIKYQNAKNNSLNILDTSYRRMLSTIKTTTGVDINQAINDSVKAFK